MEGFTGWPEAFAQKYRKDGYWLDKTISEVMKESFEKFSSNIALKTINEQLTYSEIGKLSTRLALHLNSHGLKLYDRVVLQIKNQPEVLITYFAVLEAGGIPIMALPAHRDAEIEHFTLLAEAKGLAINSKIKDFDYQEMANRIQSKAPTLDLVLVTGENVKDGFLSIDEMLKDPIEERVDPSILPRPNPDMPAVLQLSGGTTGVSKLIPRTHNDYTYNFLCNAEVNALSESTVLLIAIPQTHNFAVACPGTKGLFSRGGCEVLSDNPSPENLMKLIQKFKVTHWIAVPALILGVLNHPNRRLYDLSSLKMILTGGSKLNPEVALRIRPELNCDVQQVLGMAEGPLIWTRIDDPDEIKFYTQGRPQSPADEFKIVNPDTGEDVPEGEMGELWCRGPHTIRGYYRVPEHNKKAFSPDGFYKSGDLVRLHHSGNIIVEGRIKDTINRGGEKISAEEMENHILAYPSVNTCAYVAMPDPILGEKACAFIVLKEGSQMTLEALNDFLIKDRKIAKFKLPERVEFVKALPLTNVGKVNKKHLREIIAEQIEKEKAK